MSSRLFQFNNTLNNMPAEYSFTSANLAYCPNDRHFEETKPEKIHT